MHRPLTQAERILLFVLLLIIGISSRFLPHLPGATALTAIIFASATYLGPRASVALALITLLLTDALLGGYELPVMASVYGSFLIITGLGALFSRANAIGAKAALLLLSPLTFYLVTNTAVWYFTPWYAKDAAGLASSLLLGLPFLKNMLIADVLFTTGLLVAIGIALKPTVTRLTTAYVA